MSHKTDWVSYLIASIYSTILIGCLIGIRKNFLKKRALNSINEYRKQQRVIRWRYRFYFILFSSILIRIITIISAMILGKTMVLSKANSEQEFFWSCLASISSMLFFTAFTFIIWFFASLTFHKQQKYKRFITPFFTTINVALYISAISIGISSYAANAWDLVYDYELPLFAICSWILAICFIFLSYKISGNIHRERTETAEYIEHSRRFSVTHSQTSHVSQQQQQQPMNHSPLMDNQNESQHRIPLPMPVHYGAHANEEKLNTTNIQNRSMYVITRLVRLSWLCALCWIVRGGYLMALRIWSTTDKSPFDIPELAWEAIFYFGVEYPPSLMALIFMIAKPKRQIYDTSVNA
eukprot:492011_1